MRKLLDHPIQVEWWVRHCSDIVLRGRQRGGGYLPVTTEFNLRTTAGEQARYNETKRHSHILLHYHPAESIAYCMRLICNLEGRGG